MSQAKKKTKKKQNNHPLRLEWVQAGSLADNPNNWRKHPDGQMSALKNVISDPDIGWAGACLYNERTKRLIDGHARKSAVDAKTLVPVLVGSWSDAAEKKILLTLDPLADNAGLAGLFIGQSDRPVFLNRGVKRGLIAGCRHLT